MPGWLGRLWRSTCTCVGKARAGHLALRIRYRLFPPPIWSPYLYNPSFLKEYHRILTTEAAKAEIVVEFGPRDGYSTAILARACTLVYSFDTFEKVPFETVAHNLRGFHNICLCQGNVNAWPKIACLADLIYIDVGNTAELIDRIHTQRNYIPNATILFEGAARFTPKAPHEVLCPIWPGIGKLLP